MFGDEEVGPVDRIRSRGRVVVVDGHRRRRENAQRCSGWTAQGDAESLRPFGVRIVDDEHEDRLRTLTRSKTERADAGNVITSRRRVAIDDAAVLRPRYVACRVIHRRRSGGVARAVYVERQLRTVFTNTRAGDAKLDC